MNAEFCIPLDAFVRSISINRDTPHRLFLGAGASVSSGIPSAEKCIMEWKGRLFTSANPGLEKEVGHLFAAILSTSAAATGCRPGANQPKRMRE